MEKGQIRVQTENIFPIIKKFLYSDHEIFIRELVSNAVDATQKLKTLFSNGEAKGELGNAKIDIILDSKNKTITIIDMGVGMTKEEVDKYINQVAFSGAEEFVNKYKDVNIIGHFGLGFYSSFMVAKKVEIYSQSYQLDAPSVYWNCDGNPEFELIETDKQARGTKIILHVNDDSTEFLDQWKIQDMLKKFCRFLPIPIYFTNIEEPKEKKEAEEIGKEDAEEIKETAEEIKETTEEPKKEPKPINDTNPIWMRKPVDLTKDDYEAFYKEMYPLAEVPLFWIHLNVDYPFNLTGVLYFPKVKERGELKQDKIQLYCNQVFVTDEVKNIVPEFLTLLHGVIDSPDIPLNVSRSYLQGDPNVKKINTYITKKVADKLEEIFKNDRKELENKWESLNLFVRFGMMTEDKFFDKAQHFCLFPACTDEKLYTFDEYRMSAETLQKNKEEKLVVLYTNDPIQQDAFISQCKEKNYIVLKMDGIFDAAFINRLESKIDKITFKRVDADIIDHLINLPENKDSVLTKEETEQLKKIFEINYVPNLRVNVEVKGLDISATPITAIRPEFSRRMKDMHKSGMGGMYSMFGSMGDEVNIILNGNHPIFQSLLKEQDQEKRSTQVRTLTDLALLSQGLLTGNALTQFINRSVSILQDNVVPA